MAFWSCPGQGSFCAPGSTFLFNKKKTNRSKGISAPPLTAWGLGLRVETLYPAATTLQGQRASSAQTSLHPVTPASGWQCLLQFLVAELLLARGSLPSRGVLD